MDVNGLVATKEYKYGNYSFERFNPLQSLAFPFVDKDVNVVVDAKTSAGKTIVGELFAGKSLVEGKAIVYLSPLKALAEEKYQDWSNSSHPWYEYSISILTGDYILTEAKQRELNSASIIISTYEMMAVRCRNSGSERSDWLKDIGVIIVDEAHFLCSEGRGDHLEHSLILLSKINPSAKIVFLSATMVNSDDVCAWVQLLNQKETILVKSDYRPVPLKLTFIAYDLVAFNYAEEQRKILSKISLLLATYKEDQWLIFVHAKAFGKMALEAAAKIFPKQVGYHNADLDKASRTRLEADFKAGRIRCLIATSTLAYGLNLPARRVIIAGLKRGMAFVDPLDIIQECGRAGRPKYDTEGDAYIIMAKRSLRDGWDKLIQNGVAVCSRLHEKLGFHLIGEIAEKRVLTSAQALDWSKRSLAHHQKLILGSKITDTINLYKDNHLITSHNENDFLAEQKVSANEFEATVLGKIASKHYFDPMEVVAWRHNIYALYEREVLDNDAALAWMIGNTSMCGYMAKEMRRHSLPLLQQLKLLDLFFKGDGALAIGTFVYHHLNGKREVTKLFPSIMVNFQSNLDRMMSCWRSIDSRVFHHKNNDYWEKLKARLLYGVIWAQAELCMIPGIGAAYSKLLIEHGIKDQAQFYAERDMVKSILPYKLFQKIFKAEDKGTPSEEGFFAQTDQIISN